MEVSLETMTPDPVGLILKCARVSSDQSNTTTGLIGYMVRHGHWSPFEMAHAVFEITTSRAIAQQILRHWSFAFQEFSQRYADPTEIGFETYPARRQSEKNRQSSIDDLPDDIKAWFSDAQKAVQGISTNYYTSAIEKGIAKEQARFLLPVAVSTKMYMAGSIRSWIHYCKLRCQDDVQLEHREIANAIRLLLFYGQLPVIGEALDAVNYWSDI